MRNLAVGEQFDPARHGGWRAADAVNGAVMLVDRAVFERIGLLDEDYFFSFEEIDFCVRAADAGFAIGLTGDAVAYHLGGGTLHAGFRAALLLRRTEPPAPRGTRRVAEGVAGALRTCAIVAFSAAHALTAPGGRRPLASRRRARRDDYAASGRTSAAQGSSRSRTPVARASGSERALGLQPLAFGPLPCRVDAWSGRGCAARPERPSATHATIAATHAASRARCTIGKASAARSPWRRAARIPPTRARARAPRRADPPTSAAGLHSRPTTASAGRLNAPSSTRTRGRSGAPSSARETLRPRPHGAGGARARRGARSRTRTAARGSPRTLARQWCRLRASGRITRR